MQRPKYMSKRAWDSLQTGIGLAVASRYIVREHPEDVSMYGIWDRLEKLFVPDNCFGPEPVSRSNARSTALELNVSYAQSFAEKVTG